MSTSRTILAGLVVLTGSLWTSPCQAIEAVRGKTYTLTKQHGPWLVMVASLNDVAKDERQEGLSAEEAAHELVFELREKGIPAYVFSQEARIEKIETVDRQGREDDRIYAAQRGMFCVLAGNYPSVEDAMAVKTLKWIKGYKPQFMKQSKSGAIYRETPGKKGPLSGAFLTINPLLDPSQVADHKPDPLLLRLNNHCTYPLIGCKQPYTVQVASFTGKSATAIGNSQYRGNEAKFDRLIQSSESYGLNRAGEDAEQLTAALRNRGIEAYVYHDRYQSVVTVGGFNTPNDPKSVEIIQKFGPHPKPDPQTGQEIMLPEVLVIPTGKKGEGTALSWVFDVQPHVVKVPRLKKS